MNDTYIYQRLNSGIIKMQSGLNKAFPVPEFVSCCNNALDLTNENGDFYNFVAEACQSTDELNEFITSCGKFRGQIKDKAIKLKNGKQPFYVMDREYFMSLYEEAQKTQPESEARTKATLNLYKAFSETMKSVIKENETNYNKMMQSQKNKFKQ